jgi:hypothetical protein
MSSGWSWFEHARACAITTWSSIRSDDGMTKIVRFQTAALLSPNVAVNWLLTPTLLFRVPFFAPFQKLWASIDLWQVGSTAPGGICTCMLQLHWSSQCIYAWASGGTPPCYYIYLIKCVFFLFVIDLIIVVLLSLCFKKRLQFYQELKERWKRLQLIRCTV